MKTRFFKLLIGSVLQLSASISTIGQTDFKSPEKQQIAVLSFDSKELVQSSDQLANLARLKLQSVPNLSVLRHYDVEEHFLGSSQKIEDCFSTKCLTQAGKSLGVQLMLTGTAERFGERIVVNVSLIDVQRGVVVASDLNEYYNLGAELEGMIEISINNVFGLESDQALKNALEKDSDVLNDQVVERINLNGPRMGVGYVGGIQGKRLMDSRNQNGYEMLPIMTQFGYQFEWQYMSAGNMQALIELVPLISGMDQGKFIPSVTLMNGFRHSRTGWEFAFGPTFRLNQMADGYYDNDHIWRRAEYWNETQADENGNVPNNPNDVHRNIDSKGDFELVYGFTLAAGKTFKSGHLNMPVNVYVTPGLHGFLAGASFGFNVRKKNRSL